MNTLLIRSMHSDEEDGLVWAKFAIVDEDAVRTHTIGVRTEDIHIWFRENASYVHSEVVANGEVVDDEGTSEHIRFLYYVGTLENGSMRRSPVNEVGIIRKTVLYLAKKYLDTRR